MLHTIGRKRESEALVDLLLACHGRIRSFLDLAVAVGERSEATDDDVADASARVRRYFADALPLHVEDEEEGVLPRLYGRSVTLDAALDRMCAEHDTHRAPLRRLLAAAAAGSVAPSSVDARAELGRAASALRDVLEPHLREEEVVVFDAARRLLTQDDERAIVSELRARRRRT